MLVSRRQPRQQVEAVEEEAGVQRGLAKVDSIDDIYPRHWKRKIDLMI